MANTTKRMLSMSLKKLLSKTTLDSITIQDITDDAEVSRKTFYYHFQDKYELLSWIYYNENFSRITEDITFDNWDQKILEMLQIMEKEKTFYVNTLKEQEHTFESYLFEMAKALFLEAIARLDEKNHLNDVEREFDAEFYAYGICGVIVSWTQSGMRIKPEIVAEHLRSLAKDTERIGYIRSQGLL